MEINSVRRNIHLNDDLFIYIYIISRNGGGDGSSPFFFKKTQKKKLRGFLINDCVPCTALVIDFRTI